MSDSNDGAEARARRLDAVDAEGKGLRIEFFWSGDRFAHRILLLAAVGEHAVGDHAGREQLVIDSVEGDDRDAWPPSAPLQQLSIERRGGTQVALLVGMAGRSHWSASIEARPERRSLTFDIACRARDLGDVGALGSRYRVASPLTPLTPQSAGGCEARIAAQAGFVRLQSEAVGGQPPATLQVSADAVSILPVGPCSQGGPSGTIRWKYLLDAP